MSVGSGFQAPGPGGPLTVLRFCVSLGALLHVASAVMAQPAAERTAVLAVERGRLLQPVARFDGRAWTPVSAAPGTWPREWTRWSSSGAAANIAASPRRADGRCPTPRTLLVDAPIAAAESGTATGFTLVSSGGLDVRRLRPVAARSAEWGAATSAVDPLFERRAAENGISRTILARVPAALDSMVESGAPGAPVYYFEASKRVPDAGHTPEGEPKGIVRLSISGWLRTDSDRLSPAGTRAELHWDPAETREPLPAPALVAIGVVRQPEGDLWLMKTRAAPRESFDLYFVMPSFVRRLLSVEAAVC